MKYVKIKKLFIAITFFIICLFIFPEYKEKVSAEGIERITILGDSISEGYGLSIGEKNYGKWLSEYCKADVSNYAVSGDTTQDLLDILENNKEASESIKQSQLICISIGANDIMHPFLEGLQSINFSYSHSEESGTKISVEGIENLLKAISTDLISGSSTACTNIEKITDIISGINPEAELLFQTVYNPFETSDSNFKAVFKPIYTFAEFYLATINSNIKKNNKTIYADIYKKFKGNCPEFTNMRKLDIHPNKLGHLLIAEEIAQVLNISGEGEVFTNGLTKIIEEGVYTVPEKIEEEFELLSAGKFRTDAIMVQGGTELPETETTSATTSTTTTVTTTTEITSLTTQETTLEYTGTADNDNEEETEEKVQKNPTGMLLNIGILIMIAIILIVAVHDYKKNKETNEGDEK